MQIYAYVYRSGGCRCGDRFAMVAVVWLVGFGAFGACDCRSDKDREIARSTTSTVLFGVIYIRRYYNMPLHFENIAFEFNVEQHTSAYARSYFAYI